MIFPPRNKKNWGVFSDCINMEEIYFFIKVLKRGGKNLRCSPFPYRGRYAKQINEGGQPMNKRTGPWRKAGRLIQLTGFMLRCIIQAGERKEPDYEISFIHSGL